MLESLMMQNELLFKQNTWVITTTSIVVKPICLLPLYKKNSMRYIKEMVFNSIMLLDNYKNCGNIFASINNNQFKKETTEMLLCEIVFCYRNGVKDMRWHLLLAIVEYHESTPGRPTNFEYLLKKYYQSVREFKQINGYNGSFH